jgi:hypothetical protein
VDEPAPLRQMIMNRAGRGCADLPRSGRVRPGPLARDHRTHLVALVRIGAHFGNGHVVEGPQAQRREPPYPVEDEVARSCLPWLARSAEAGRRCAAVLNSY